MKVEMVVETSASLHKWKAWKARPWGLNRQPMVPLWVDFPAKPMPI
jgi:hypothetical protein